MESAIKIGVSACLLGQPVRYNGGHAHDRYITDTLGKFFHFLPVCPEVECGFGTPREAFRLVGDPERPRFMTSRTAEDFTQRMEDFCIRRAQELEGEQLSGFIFKSRSPSSGMERVKVYTEQGMPVNKGVGLFARAFMERFPLVPVEEEGRLHDPRLRENFIESVFVFRRWRDVPDGRGALVRFHTQHKLLLMSHAPGQLRRMGKLVAEIKDMDPVQARADYRALLLEALKLKPTVRKHVNVLQHIMGYFKKALTRDEKSELSEVIEDYRREYVPLIVPITLLNHFVRKYNQEYLRDQHYLNPHPVELKLRNHV
jgi:uncharacterized protein YbgA (DUF1722 family)/uncharacterized protein YbbK (DUF523 family)